MNSIIKFIELENRVISANYRNLMIKAKVVLVDKASGKQLPDPVATIASPQRIVENQVAGLGEVGDLLFESSERARRGRRAKRRVPYQLDQGFAGFAGCPRWQIFSDNCQLPGLPPVV